MSVTKNHQRKIQKYQLLDSSKSPQNVLTVNITLALMPGMWPLSWLLSIEAALRHPDQWCIAKNEGGYMQTGVAKGLKVPCLFMIAEVSIRYQKNSGGWYTPYTRISPPNTPLILTPHSLGLTLDTSVSPGIKWQTPRSCGSAPWSRHGKPRANHCLMTITY